MTTEATTEPTPEERLKELGLELPSVPAAVGDYEPWVEVNGVIYTSGQLPGSTASCSTPASWATN